jgi:predicted amidohydrolase
MRICVAQTRPVKGDIQTNIRNHKTIIDVAVSHAADIIIFPELSLTGYEPELAKDLAIDTNDTSLSDFQTLSDTHEITIGVGMPTKNGTAPSISMIIFQPRKARQVYSKKYLHADEEPFFVSGENLLCSLSNQTNVALAICYELSIPEHAENAFKTGGEIYIASVAKSVSGIAKATERLADIAKTYSMTVLMSNCIGLCDGMDCGGRTSAWNNKGVLLGQLDDVSEGILILDTETQEVTSLVIEDHLQQKNLMDYRTAL